MHKARHGVMLERRKRLGTCGEKNTLIKHSKPTEFDKYWQTSFSFYIFAKEKKEMRKKMLLCFVGKKVTLTFKKYFSAFIILI